MNKHALKEMLIAYINKQDMIDGEYDPGCYYFTAVLNIKDENSISVSNPSLTLLVTKK